MVDAVHGRGWANAELENWERAQRDYARALKLSDKPSMALCYEQALVGVSSGDTEHYPATCRELLTSLLAEFSDTSTPPALISHLVIAIVADGPRSLDTSTVSQLLQRRITASKDDGLAKIARASVVLRESASATDANKTTTRDQTSDGDFDSALAALQSIVSDDSSTPEAVALAAQFVQFAGGDAKDSVTPDLSTRSWNRRLLVSWVREKLSASSRLDDGPK